MLSVLGELRVRYGRQRLVLLRRWESERFSVRHVRFDQNDYGQRHRSLVVRRAAEVPRGVGRVIRRRRDCRLLSRHLAREATANDE